jgi:hypothetical protein
MRDSEVDLTAPAARLGADGGEDSVKIVVAEAHGENPPLVLAVERRKGEETRGMLWSRVKVKGEGEVHARRRTRCRVALLVSLSRKKGNGSGGRDRVHQRKGIGLKEEKEVGWIWAGRKMLGCLGPTVGRKERWARERGRSS